MKKKEGQKQKTEKREERKRKKDRKLVITMAAMHCNATSGGARKAAWAKKVIH